VSVLSEIVFLGSTLFEISAFRTLINPDPSWQLSDADIDEMFGRVDFINGIVGLIYLVVWVVVTIFCAVWICRASANARTIQPSENRVRPGWAVGYFFVPIINLWMPFKAMKQIWNSSHSPDGCIDDDAPGFFMVWWGAWLVGNAGSSAATRAYSRAETPEAALTADWVFVFSSVVLTVSALQFMRIIREVAVAQALRAREAPVARPASGLDDDAISISALLEPEADETHTRVVPKP
jgi:heme/copper-type cytochrome/quinol oxidase subunit 2